LDSLTEALPGEKIGAAVMNCNPFTLGHRYLIETAAKECDHVYVFVLSEDQSRFSTHDRMEMVRLGTADLANVTVLPTGPYLISNATFPTYFLKDREGASQVHCKLDIAIFENYFVPKFGITHRYVGTEPLSPVTAQYNEALKENLKKVTLVEIPRLETGTVPVSASAVRSALDAGEDIRKLVPESTYQYVIQGGNNHG
jgi:[citrate (pro-3S)-lyase] ligase